MQCIMGRFLKSALFGKYRKDEHFCFLGFIPTHYRMVQAVRVQCSKFKKNNEVAIWQLSDKKSFFGILVKKRT